MGKKLSLILVLIIVASQFCTAQNKESNKIRLNHYSLTVGVGWSHFINNLEYGDENISQDFAGLSLKFFWEPEHRLSLGLESGYYKLFRIKSQITPDVSIKVDRVVVPFLLLVRMRIVDNIYLGTGMGLAVITNKAVGAGDRINNDTWSLSNYQISGSYIYPLSRFWRIGGEAKIFNFGNMNDWMYSLQLLVAARL